MARCKTVAQKAIIFSLTSLIGAQAMDLHLRGKNVLITGASKGIGAATAEAFAEEGSNVHLAARSTEAMQELADFQLPTIPDAFEGYFWR